MSVEKLKQGIQRPGGTSAELREKHPNDPAGEVELSDEELGSVAGGDETGTTVTTGTTDLNSTECCTLHPKICEIEPPDTLTVG